MKMTTPRAVSILAMTAFAVFCAHASGQSPAPAPTAPARPAPVPAPTSTPATGAFGAPASGAVVEPELTTPKPSPRPAETATAHSTASSTRLPVVIPTGCTVWPNDPALLKLEAEREALEMVDHASRLGAEESGRRISAMHAFIDQRNMESAWARFSRQYVPTLDQLTFDEATARAKSQAAGTVPTPDTNDVDHLEQAVEVESGVARASWNLLNRHRRAVDTLTAFLLQENVLGDYQGWAPGYMRAMGWKAQGPDAGQAPNPDAVRRRAVQLEWDRAQREQRAQVPQGWEPGNGVPAGSTPSNVPSENGVIPAPVSLGASPARSIYSNSWWNGYADPYYDTGGFPGRDPNLNVPMADDPKTYGWAPEAYTYTARPAYWDLGPNVHPAAGMFPGGMVGGAGFGLSGGAGAAVGAVGVGSAP